MELLDAPMFLEDDLNIVFEHLATEHGASIAQMEARTRLSKDAIRRRMHRIGKLKGLKVGGERIGRTIMFFVRLRPVRQETRKPRG